VRSAGAREEARARGWSLHPQLFRSAPGSAMGNVPSAVKHCLSYQQLLREHLWIGDSVAGALDSAQVPPRGRGRGAIGLSPPLGHLGTLGPFLRQFCGSC
jgi:hypothetical protein